MYFDNAATTAHKPEIVARTVYDALAAGEYGNPSRGAHDYAMRAYRIIAAAKEDIKTLFRAGNAYEVAFTHNSTVALNMIIKGLLGAGDHIISTTWEHNAVLRPLYQLEAAGASLDFVTSDAGTGALHYDEFEKLLRSETKAVVCNHASNVTGNIMDLDFIKRFCKKHGLMLIVDMSQTAGAYPIDMADGIITAACFTGHKSLYGPGGTGGMVVRTGLDVKPLITGGDGLHTFDREFPHTVPGVFEAGTENIAGIAGLSAGVRLLLERGEDGIMATQQHLADIFTAGIQDIPNLTLYADFRRPRVNVFAVNIGEAEAALVGEILWEEFEMATRAGFHCAPLIHKELHTNKRGIVRFSFSLYTTEEEVRAAAAALKDIAAR
mgnify:FL=1